MSPAREMMSQAKEKLSALPSQSILAAKLMAGEFIDLYAAHPKKMTVFLIVELWIHSLVFQHLHEIKTLRELFPVIGALFGL